MDLNALWKINKAAKKKHERTYLKAKIPHM